MTENGTESKLLGTAILYRSIRFRTNITFLYFYIKLIFNDSVVYYFLCRRTEQTATLKVDGGHIITGASPGKLRQLNGNGHLFIGILNLNLQFLFVSLF
jgi:hypothetical protein